MGNLNDAIMASLAEWLRDRGIDAVEVTSWEDGTKSGGYCETCYYEYASVDMYYTDSEGNTKYYEYDGSFSELIASF